MEEENETGILIKDQNKVCSLRQIKGRIKKNKEKFNLIKAQMNYS